MPISLALSCACARESCGGWKIGFCGASLDRTTNKTDTSTSRTKTTDYPHLIFELFRCIPIYRPTSVPFQRAHNVGEETSVGDRARQAAGQAAQPGRRRVGGRRQDGRVRQQCADSGGKYSAVRSMKAGIGTRGGRPRGLTSMYLGATHERPPGAGHAADGPCGRGVLRKV